MRHRLVLCGFLGLCLLPQCTRADTDAQGNPWDSSRPDTYSSDPSLAPIVGGNGGPGSTPTTTTAPMSPNVPVAPAVFTAASAYFTAPVGGLPAILTLVDLPISCADLRAATGALAPTASLLRVHLGDANFSGSYAFFDSNGVNTGSLATGRAVARMSRPTTSAVATQGSITLTQYAADSQLSGNVTATLADGTSLSNLPFVASFCP